MFFFLMKKVFFDGWDNLETLVITNLVIFVTGIALIWPLLVFPETSLPIFLALLGVITIFGAMLLGVVSALMSALADYRRVTWADVPRFFKKTWKQCLIFGIAAMCFVMVSLLGIIYYSNFKNLLGIAASVVLFWILIGAYLTGLWYFPARSRLQGNFRILIKKSALLMLDNFLLSLYLGFVIVPLFLIAWPMTAFTAFGPSGILLYLSSALRLLMCKYAWREGNPGAKRGRVPWLEILADEKERIGKRTLKGMIFPWKE